MSAFEINSSNSSKDARDTSVSYTHLKNVALLDDEDKQHVQSEIDYILKKKG